MRDLRKTNSAGVSLRIRLFVFLLVLVVTMIALVVMVLSLMGVLSAGSLESERLIQKELSGLSKAVESRYGDTSVQAVLLSEALSESLEANLGKQGIRVPDLQAHPEVLEGLLESELTRLLLALEKTKCSGVFVVLDATVNPALPGAGTSRAGVYLRNAEPNVVGDDSEKLYVRGFPKIALRNGLSLQSKWDMEFDVKGRSFFAAPLAAQAERRLPLSRLYYWSYDGAVPELGEDVMLCSIPLIDSEGVAFGVCGFEMSTMNFKYSFAPDTGLFSHAVCMISPCGGGVLGADGALVSGNIPAFQSKPLAVTGRYGALTLYAQDGGGAFVGQHETIKLYPADAPFSERQSAVSVLIPKEDMDALRVSYNVRVALICALLLAGGAGLSIFLSKRYVAPIHVSMDALLSSGADSAAKTNIHEIDELIERILARRSHDLPPPDDIFEDFLQRVKTLTPTEMTLFKYYLDGKSNNEILSILFISTNTLKTHNSHIYAKLRISSKDELLLYFELLRKSGRLDDLFPQAASAKRP